MRIALLAPCGECMTGGTGRSRVLDLEVADQSGEKLDLVLRRVAGFEILDFQFDGMSKISVDCLARCFDSRGDVFIVEELRVSGRQSGVDINKHGVEVIHALHRRRLKAGGAVLMHILYRVLRLLSSSLERFGTDVPGERARTIGAALCNGEAVRVVGEPGSHGAASLPVHLRQQCRVDNVTLSHVGRQFGDVIMDWLGMIGKGGAGLRTKVRNGSVCGGCRPVVRRRRVVPGVGHCRVVDVEEELGL